MEKVVTDSRKIEEFLGRGPVEIIEREDLKKELLSGKRLRGYIGYDVTGPELHLGHGATLMKLRDLQELGHQVIVVIGDFTARVGDHSGLLEKRKRLSPKEIETNKEKFISQFAKILDIEKAEVRFNSEWLSDLNFNDVIELAQLFTVQQMIERESFAQRIKERKPVGLEELLYPLMQGYDSVALKTDIEIGGTDQTFNLLAGRKVMEAFGIKPQNIITMPLISGTDGRKMSKSLGNYIPMTASAEDIYGGIMSAVDEVIIEYFKLLTRVPLEEIAAMGAQLKEGAANPMELKKKLAYEVTKIYYDEPEAHKAQEHFEKVVQKGEIPEDVREIEISEKELPIVELLTRSDLAESHSQAKRLIEQGAVEIDGEKIEDKKTMVKIVDGMIIRAGKRNFARIRV